jgi:hypothetical protein
MQKAGVIDKPDIYYLHEAKAGVHAKASGLQARVPLQRPDRYFSSAVFIFCFYQLAR